MRNLANISIKEFRAVLLILGLTNVRNKGGHEAWMKSGMTRPVIFQTHVEPIPEFIIRNNLRNLGINKEEFLAILERI
jgi:predicted RNA binding protein YcfA (HicA-like mRNA interferase family)